VADDLVDESVGGLALGLFEEATAKAADHLFAYEGT
jgi:hypothetical protein